jgi:Tfp pilus assembly protein PilO
VTRTNKILIAVVAMGLAVCAFYFLALGPQRKQVAKLDTSIAAKQAEAAQAQQTLATYEVARKSYKANYATLARLGKAVPADDDVRSLLVQLEATSEGTGVEFQKIELGAGLAGADSSPAKTTPTDGQLASAPGAIEVAGGALSAMPFTFTFTGGYFDLNTFFAKLEHFVTINNQKIDATGRLLRLESVAIGPSSAGFPNMQAQIGAATYLVPPVEPIAGAATPGSTQQASTTPTAPSTESASSSTTTATAGAAQ